MKLNIRLGSDFDLAEAQDTVTRYHYLRTPVHYRARPMAYIVDLDGWDCGLIIAGLPHATRCRGWWGYPGLPTQWQVVDLCRIWLDPVIQAGGRSCRPDLVPGFTDRRGRWQSAAASWAVRQVLNRIQTDRVSLWPPVYLDQPYHIR